jgi:hypothetical protein
MEDGAVGWWYCYSYRLVPSTDVVVRSWGGGESLGTVLLCR